MIMCKVLSVQFIFLVALLQYGNGQNIKESRNPISAEIQDVAPAASDSILAETGFAGAVQTGSKYFQYAHVPTKDHYEHGHKRGNEHHFIERHEKAHPHEGEFKTKVRWGDKHGGYGEHYWDYNHAGHDGHDGEESQYNEQVVEYTESPVSNNNNNNNNNGRNRRRTNNDDVEFINEDSRLQIQNDRGAKHGGNYRRLLDHERIRREFRHF